MSDITRVLEGHQDWINAVAFSPDGKQLASDSIDRTVKIWDLETGTLTQEFKQPAAPLALGFSPNGKLFAIGNLDRALRIHDASSWSIVDTTHYGDLVRSLVFSPDGTTLAFECGSTKLIDLATGTVVPVTNNSSLFIVFSPDGEVLVGGNCGYGHTGTQNFAGELYFWHIPTGHSLQMFHGGDKKCINSVAFSSDGLRLAVAGDELKIWRLPEDRMQINAPTLLCTLQGHAAYQFEIAYSPISNIVAGVGDDRFVRLWNVDTQEMVALEGHFERMWAASGKWHGERAVAFSPNGRVLASGGDDGTVRVWQVPSWEQLEAYARQTAERYLAEERKRAEEEESRRSREQARQLTEEERLAKEALAQHHEEMDRLSKLRNERRARGVCVNCGKPLVFLDKVLRREHHSDCWGTH